MPTTQITPQSTQQTATAIFVPTGNADQELEWFFTMAESDMGDRSNYASSMIHLTPAQQEDLLDMRAEAAHAQRILLERIRGMDHFDAGVLQAAYVARPGPLALREELGRLTGVVVRLAAAEAGLPEDRDALEALELRTAERLNAELAHDPGTVRRLQRRASAMLQRAFVAYVRERGGPDAPLVRGIP
jgi:hypothetical protein